MVLETELSLFERLLPELLKHNRGQFAVLKGDVLLGAFSTFEEAFGAGVGEWGTEPFLIRQVTEEQARSDFPALAGGLLHAHP